MVSQWQSPEAETRLVRRGEEPDRQCLVFNWGETSSQDAPSCERGRYTPHRPPTRGRIRKQECVIS